jgi:hypothetical protein
VKQLESDKIGVKQKTAECWANGMANLNPKPQSMPQSMNQANMEAIMAKCQKSTTAYKKPSFSSSGDGENPNKSGSHTVLIVLLALGILSLVGVLGFLVYRKLRS